MPEWVRVLLTVAAGAWMIGWIIVIARLAAKFTAQLMGEDDRDKEKSRLRYGRTNSRQDKKYLKLSIYKPARFVKEEDIMISIDLKVLIIGEITIFIIRGCLGVIIMALMSMAKDKHYGMKEKEDRK